MLQPLPEQISAAFVLGSVAKRTDTASSDIDLFVVSETLTYADLYPVLEEAGQRLGRPVNPTIYTATTLAERTRDNNAFVRGACERGSTRRPRRRPYDRSPLTFPATHLTYRM